MDGAAEITAQARSKESCKLQFVFLLLMVSVAAARIVASRTPAAAANSRPRRFGTSAANRAASLPLSSASALNAPSRTALASAICGTAFGETKAAASMEETPAARSLAMSANFVFVSTIIFSFCKPSLGDTSTTRTEAGNLSKRLRPSVPRAAAAAAYAEEDELKVAACRGQVAAPRPGNNNGGGSGSSEARSGRKEARSEGIFLARQRCFALPPPPKGGHTTT
mmetsp:Transcript_96009/g.275647  ORF Transcript_96009/g.275647 Transcript_96009/m.275647 type:complete len:224 (+) Transcript_96009:139-810(+)